MELLNFTDLIDVNELKTILTNIYNLTKMPLTLVDCNNNILFEIGVLQICTDFHFKNEEALQTCIKHKENIKNIIYKQTYKCDNNLLHIIIPIITENINIGNLIIGQFFYDNEEIDYALYIEQAKKFHYDIDGYVNSLNKIPVFSKEYVENIIELCVNIISQTMKTNLTNSKLKTNEKLLRILINSMPDIVCFKDGEGKWIEANDFDLNLFGLNGIDYKGKKDSELAKYSEFYKDAFLTCEVSDEITWQKKEITRCEEIIPKSNGKEYTFDVIKIPLFENNERKGLIVVGRDITEQKKAVLEMFEAEKQFKQLFESMAEGVAFHEIIYGEDNNPVNYKITNVNSSYEKILNVKKQDILNKTATEVYKLNTAPYLKEYNSVSQNRENYQFETYFSSLDKYFHISVISFKKGTFVTIFFDVTEQRKAEQKIIELNKSLESRIIALTQPLDDLSDLKFEDIFNIDEIQKIQNAFSDATGVASMITKADGTPITKPSNFCGLCNLIRKTEKGLKNCQHSDSIIGSNYNGKKYIMQSCYSGGLLEGGTSINVGNKHVANWLIGQVIDENIDEAKILNYADEIGIDKTIVKEEFLKVTKMSKDKFEKICIALQLISNQLSYLAIQNIQQARFIMDRKKAEERLKESDEIFKLFMENLKAVVFIYNSKSQFIFTNEYFSETHGNNYLGKMPNDLFPKNPEIVLKMINENKEALEKGFIQTYDDFFDVKNSKRYFETYKFKIPSKNGDMIGGIAFDITERKQAEENLKENEETFRLFMDNLKAAVFIKDSDLRAKFTNKYFYELFGDYLIGRTPFELFPNNPEIALKMAQDDIDVMNGKVEMPIFEKVIDINGNERYFETYKFKIPAKTGNMLGGIALEVTEVKKIEEKLKESRESFFKLIDIIPNGIVIHKQGKIEYINNSALKIMEFNTTDNVIGKNVFSFVHHDYIEIVKKRVVGQKDTEILIEEKFITAKNNIIDVEVSGKMFNYDGEVLNIVAFRDITERKKAEEIIQNQIKELETKNAEMERFTYTVSHDLKSPLITIKGFLGILNNDIKEQKEDLIQKDISRISNAADKMQNLLEDLLELSRIGRMVNPSSKFSMNDVLKDVVELLNGVIANKNIKIIIQNNMPIVFGDRQRIYEVMQNLIENAIKFIGKTENPIIEIGYNNNKFFVKDNGIGIDNKYLTKIFGLFDKLDKNSEGTGIGLALVKRIIELHHGTVWVESEGLNKGATFYFTLP